MIWHTASAQQSVLSPPPFSPPQKKELFIRRISSEEFIFMTLSK